VAVIGGPTGGPAGGADGLYATDGSGNPIEAAPTDPDQSASVSEADVTGAPVGGTGAHFTFGPDASFEQSEGAGGAILYFDDLPLGAGSNFTGTGAAFASGLRDGPPVTPPFSSGGGGGGSGGLLFTHGLPQGPSSNSWGGQSLMQGGGNTSQSGDANHSIQVASFQLAVDRLSSGPGSIVTGNSASPEHLSFTSPAGGNTTDFFTSGTWGVVHNLSTSLPSSVTDQAAFSISGMAPTPGGLAIWGLLGLVFGGAGWRHRRRLLAIA